MQINIDLGEVKLAESKSHTVKFDVAGVTKAKVGCGSCTRVTSLKPDEITFAFTPDQLGQHNKHITLRNADDTVLATIFFKAVAV